MRLGMCTIRFAEQISRSMRLLVIRFAGSLF